jgi:hypothetical protein
MTGGVHVGLRISRKLLVRLDECGTVSFEPISRSAVIRDFVVQGLEKAGVTKPQQTLLEAGKR